MENFYFIKYKECSDSTEKFTSFLEEYIEEENYKELFKFRNSQSVYKVNTSMSNFLNNCEGVEKSTVSSLFSESNESNTSLFSFKTSSTNSIGFQCETEIKKSANEKVESGTESNGKNIDLYLTAIYKSISTKLAPAEKTASKKILKEIELFCNFTREFVEANIKQFNERIDGIYGKICELGLFGIDKNEANAFLFYRLAAFRKYPMATFHLAYCYEHAIGVKRDTKAAVMLYRSSSKLGYTRALYRYSLICLKNNNVPLGLNLMRQAMHKIVNYYARKPEKFNKNTTNAFLQPFYHLGLLYMTKHSELIVDFKYAYEIFTKGAELGCKHSLFMVGEFYEHGKCFIDKKNSCNIQKDKPFIDKNEGSCILHKNCLPKNLFKAFQCYLKAAELDQSDAQEKIGRMLITLSGTKTASIFRGTESDANICEKICNEGFEYLKRSAFSGNLKGMRALAEILYSGVGRKKDVLQSLWWFNIIRAEKNKEFDVESEIQKVENYIALYKHNGF
ncbi:hypothetical protein NUSPORA_01649 [Nucleospora cyclopteri]